MGARVLTHFFRFPPQYSIQYTELQLDTCSLVQHASGRVFTVLCPVFVSTTPSPKHAIEAKTA